MPPVRDRHVPDAFDSWPVAQVDLAEVGNPVTFNLLVGLMITG
ncbi:hypothetical protein ACWC9U_17255 [Streptomyces sp. 900116325]